MSVAAERKEERRSIAASLTVEVADAAPFAVVEVLFPSAHSFF